MVARAMRPASPVCRFSPVAARGGFSIAGDFFADTRASEFLPNRREIGWKTPSAHTEPAREINERPAKNVLGPERQGRINAMKILANRRAGHAARSLGSAQYLLDQSLAHTPERAHLVHPLFDQQILQHDLAEKAPEIESLRQMTYPGALDIGSEHECHKGILDTEVLRPGGPTTTAPIGLRTFMAGAVITADSPIERFYRDARITGTDEGPSENQTRTSLLGSWAKNINARIHARTAITQKKQSGKRA